MTHARLSSSSRPASATPGGVSAVSEKTFEAASGKDTCCLQSHVLLNGQSCVSIQHNGTVYRLQATKLGKLILTK